MTKWDSLRRIWKPFQESGASVHASCACFYILLSFLPSAAFLLSALSYVPSVQSGTIGLLYQVIPEPFHPILHAALRNLLQSNSLTVLSAAGLTTLWSASKGIWAIMNGLDAMLNRERRSNYWKQRLRAIVMLTLFVVVLFMVLQLILFGSQLLQSLHAAFGITDFLWLHLPLAALTLSVFFSLIYRFLPRQRYPFALCLKTGGLVALCWVLFSRFFSIYVRYFTTGATLYGGIGLLILSAVWMQFSMIQFLYGMLYTKLLASGSYHPIQYLHEAFKPRS